MNVLTIIFVAFRWWIFGAFGARFANLKSGFCKCRGNAVLWGSFELILTQLFAKSKKSRQNSKICELFRTYKASVFVTEMGEFGEVR